MKLTLSSVGCADLGEGTMLLECECFLRGETLFVDQYQKCKLFPGFGEEATSLKALPSELSKPSNEQNE